jgi:hypothetical protein
MSDFMSDRNDNYDAQGDDATLKEKRDWQRALMKRVEAAELPSNLPWISPNEQRWWCLVGGQPPEYQRQQIQRQMKRLSRKAA